MKTTLKLLAAAAALTAGTLAHADVNLGFFGPLTGGSAPMGASVLAGLKVAVNEANAKGGLLGQKINLVERDDQAKNENGPLIAQELIGPQSVKALIGGCNTGVVLPTIPVVQDKKTVLIVPCATGVPITDAKNTYVFRTSAKDTVQTAKALEALKAQGITDVALFADTTAYGKLGEDELLKVAPTMGIKITTKQNFAVGDKDMSSQIAKAKESGAKGLVVWGIGPEVAVLAKQRVQFGWNVPMSSGWTTSMSNFIDAAGKAGNGVHMPATYLQFSASTPKQKEFNEAAGKIFGKEVLGTSIAAAQAYDAFKLYEAAVVQANSFDSDKVRVALESLQKPVDGIITTYKKPFSAGDHDAQTVETVGLGEVKDGKALKVK